MKIIKQNWLGLLGLVLLCVGITIPAGLIQNVFNVIGIFALVVYAWYGKNEFFFYLDLVVLLGTVLKIINVSSAILITALVIAATLSLIKIFLNQAYRTWDTTFGLIGLIGLVYGYSMLNSYGYAVGGIGNTVYSFIAYKKGLKSALIFTVLNVIYTTLAIYMILS